MPQEPRAGSKAARSPAAAKSSEAARDHVDGAAAIARVVNEILPPLIGRITDSELGELEVAQDGWRVRLRRDSGVAAVRGAGSSPGSQSGAAMHVVGGAASAGQHGSGGQLPAAHTGTGHTAPAAGGGQAPQAAGRGSVLRRAAVSPAVGYFTARDGLSAGQAVRAGDVLGAINVLGVTQPVVAPTDGVVSRILASAGEAVEYAQELVRIDGIERLVES